MIPSTRLLTLYFALFLTLTVSVSRGHVFRLGTCPEVEVQKDFDINKFLGEWYVLQRFQTTSQCLKLNFTLGEDGDYRVSEKGQIFGVNFFGLDHSTTQLGTITIPRPEEAGKLQVRFPLSPFGRSNYWIVMTDYKTYAATWTCRRFLFGHWQSAEILSRTPKLDREIVQKIRRRFESFGVNEHNFSFIGQNDCDNAESIDKASSVGSVRLPSFSFSIGMGRNRID